jgi:uncharacterized protein YlzI (FlbEa/FlbD family)
MLCRFIRASGLSPIYVNPLKVSTVEPTAAGEVQITFDNGGSVIVTGSAEEAAARIGEALEALSSGIIAPD